MHSIISSHRSRHRELFVHKDSRGPIYKFGPNYEIKLWNITFNSNLVSFSTVNLDIFSAKGLVNRVRGSTLYVYIYIMVLFISTSIPSFRYIKKQYCVHYWLSIYTENNFGILSKIISVYQIYFQYTENYISKKNKLYFDIKGLPNFF